MRRDSERVDEFHSYPDLIEGNLFEELRASVVLEDVSKQQLTTQKNIETGINQMNYLLARGLI